MPRRLITTYAMLCHSSLSKWCTAAIPTTITPIYATTIPTAATGGEAFRR
jgi:hypothetical protein